MIARASVILWLGALALSGCGAADTITDDAPRQPVRDTASEVIDPAPTRALLVDYFDLVEAGDSFGAARLWCVPAAASDFATRLRDMGEYRTNIAEPLAGDDSQISISLQFLTQDNATLFDARADFEAKPPGGQEKWCIARIMLQPPPVPLG